MDIKDQVRKAKRGDKEALLKLVMDKKDYYYKLAFVYTRDREDAMDALQDMIVIVYKKIKKLNKEESFYSWSNMILVNCCKEILRKRKLSCASDPYDNEAHVEEKGFSRVEDHVDVMRYLGTLSEEQQEAIKLKYFLDMDYKTIAEVIGVPEGTVKSRVSIGINKLKLKFGGEY